MFLKVLVFSSKLFLNGEYAAFAFEISFPNFVFPLGAYTPPNFPISYSSNNLVNALFTALAESIPIPLYETPTAPNWLSSTNFLI